MVDRMTDNPSVSKRPRIASRSTVTGPRVTQRPPLSCTECSRRKIKCDRSIPCRPCLDRGEDVGCQREAVAVRGEIRNTDAKTSARKTFDELQLQVEELARRVGELEQGIDRSRNSEKSSPCRDTSPLVVDSTRLPGIMEEAALGIGETSRWKKHSLHNPQDTGGARIPWFAAKSMDDCLLALPSQAQARSLVKFYIEEIAWVTGSLDLLALTQDQERFWIQLETQSVRDDIWLSLYFSVLSVAAFFVEDNRATSMNVSMPQLRSFGHACFDAAVATIFRCQGATQPSVVTCQAVQTLGPSFHFTANTSLHRSLSAVILSHARSLNLHLLGVSSSRANYPGESNRDVGRHVWWNLVEPDWAFLPYNRYCTIYPHHFTSGLSDHDLKSPPSRMVYRTVCFRAAKVLFHLFGELAVNQDPSYDAVLTVSTSLQTIREDYDRARHSRRDNGSHLEPRTQQHLVDMTLAYRDYQCHRIYFVRAITDLRYIRSYSACINAAQTISSIFSLNLAEPFHRMWNVTVMVIAAGIILALDCVFKPDRSPAENRPDHRTTVAILVNRLRELQDPSGIATRGVTLIEHLLGIKDISAITREAIQQLVDVSHSHPTPDSLWLHPSNSQNHEPHPGSFSFDPAGTIFNAEFGHSQAAFWDDTIGSGVDTDLDFARLLGQIMPNAG